MPSTSYQAQIHKALARLGTNGTENPDAASKSNTGRLMGDFFLWSEVERYAKNKREDAKAALSALVPDSLPPGTHAVAESLNFVTTATISEPVRRFKGDALAAALHKSKYKVPVPFTKEAIEAAKLPTASTVTLKVSERTP